MRTGDDFERFYLGSRRRLVGLLYTVTGDLHEAEDIIQEAFARAAADWSRISGYDVPEAWVRRVAFNLAANRRRRLVRHTAALLRLGRPADVEPRGVEDLALVDALRTLPVRQRQAVVMHHVAGLWRSHRSRPSWVCPAGRSRAGSHAAGPPWPEHWPTMTTRH
jgi:RNA polymerase sigma-70 factor (ECF subfamily)